MDAVKFFSKGYTKLQIKGVKMICSITIVKALTSSIFGNFLILLPLAYRVINSLLEVFVIFSTYRSDDCLRMLDVSANVFYKGKI